MDNFPELGHLASLLKYGIRSGSWQGSLAGPIILRNRSMRTKNTFARLTGKGFQISGWTNRVTLGPLIENTRMGLECLSGVTVPQGWGSGFDLHMVVQYQNLNTWEAEAGGSGVQAQPVLCSKLDVNTS